MQKKLDDLLCQRYPKIFADRHAPLKESSMGFGFSCGDGWFDLIDTLCERLQFWTDHNKAPQVVAVQVKEKFGGLRVYVRPRAEVTQEQWGLIRMAEAMSYRLCEKCGKPGKTMVRQHFHVTCCAEHMPEGAITMEAYLAQQSPEEGQC